MTVLNEVEGAARLQDSPQFLECCGEIGDRAQRPRGEYGIELPGRKVKMLTGQPRKSDGYVRASDTGSSKLHADPRRLDGEDPRHFRRIVANV
jgi:hypothetical protein